MKVQRAKSFWTAKRPLLLLAGGGLLFCLVLAVLFVANLMDPDPTELLLQRSDARAPLVSSTSVLYPPLNCPQFLKDVQRNRSSVRDPNQGEIFNRQTDRYPSFLIALHNKGFDPTRWAIMEWGHYYEWGLMTAFSEVLNATERRHNNIPRILDVGGNIGYFSLLAAAHGKVVVDTFEPNLINAFRMCQSLELNGWGNEYQTYKEENLPRVNCHPMGIGKEVGSLVFSERDNPGEGKFKETKSDATKDKEIQVITLDVFAQSRGWFNSPHPDIAILKVDVEGFEINVMARGKKAFGEPHGTQSFHGSLGSQQQRD